MTASSRDWEMLTDAVGLFRDPSRIVWRLEGTRPIDALHGLVTNDLRGAPDWSKIPCLALTPRGRPLADLQVWKASAGAGPLFVDLPAAGESQLREHLDRYLPPRFARIMRQPDAMVLRLIGPAAKIALSDLPGVQGLPPEPDRIVRVVSGSHGDESGRPSSEQMLVAGRPESAGDGWDLLLASPAPELEARLLSAVTARGGGEVGPEAWEIWRVEQGIPEYGRDFDLENLPQETGLTEAYISFDKGCYTGQEVVARIHYRGKVNRRLVGLCGQPPEPILPDTELFLESRPVGRITSAALSPRLGPVALGMVRREVGPETLVSTSPSDGRRLRLQELPFTLS